MSNNTSGVFMKHETYIFNQSIWILHCLVNSETVFERLWDLLGCPVLSGNFCSVMLTLPHQDSSGD